MGAKNQMQKNFNNATNEEIASFYELVSANIRHYREKSGISQLDLALEIGIKSVAFYSNCENNRYGKHFNLEHIYKLSKALQIPISSLFEPLKM